MLRHNIIPEFIILLGNCGTSDKTFFGTLDDCIVIKSSQSNRKVSLKFLKNDNRDVEVRFFDSINSKVYTSKSFLRYNITVCNRNDTLLLCIVNYLEVEDINYDTTQNPVNTANLYKKHNSLLKA